MDELLTDPAARLCPVHGVPMRRVGPLYFCECTPAEAARLAEQERAAALTARLRWVADVWEPGEVSATASTNGDAS